MVTARAARLATLTIGIAACVNIAIGVALAWRDPSRSTDLWTMYDWTRGWTAANARHYTGAHDAVDYPPNAIVVLSPLGLLPQWLVLPIWMALGAALAVAVPWLAIRCALPRSRRTVLPLLLVCCWTSTRTLLQFTPLSLALAFASALVADSRWLASGLLLGLALFKPHVAGPFALWAIVSGRLRVVAVAMAVVAGGIGAYAARTGENPIAVVQGYWPSLVQLYSGEQAMTGRTGIRESIAMAIADPGIADAVWIGASACVIVAAVWLVWRDRQRPLNDGGSAIPGLFCLCSLAAIYHNINNLILMLPAFLFLWFAADERGWPGRWLQIACLQLVLVVDIPTRFATLVPRPSLAAHLADHFDRLLVLACFVDVAMAWVAVSRRAAGAASAGDAAALPLAGAARSPR